MKKVIFLIALPALILSSCKSDFNLTAKWKEQMVIYCLLNQTDSVQYIRVNKTFLGQGNAYSMAAVHDSMNYSFLLNVRLEKWLNGALVQTFAVDTTTSIRQDSGTFANQPQILYRAHTSPLGVNALTDDGAEYRLTVTNPKTGYQASGRTKLIPSTGATLPDGSMGLQITSPFPNPTYNFYLTNFPYKFKSTSGNNTRLYNTVFRFHYTEYDAAGGTNKYVDMNFGTYTTNSLNGGEPMESDVSWSSLTHFLASSMPDNDPTVYKRVMGKCELIIYAGGDEFSTYIQVNQPVSSITGDKPTYTNIVNGIGLFSARYTYDVAQWDKPLSNLTLDNLSTDAVSCPMHIANASGVVSASCP